MTLSRSLAFAVILALGAPTARAQGPAPSAAEEEIRRGLIEKAKKAHADGAHGDALGLLEKAAAIQQTPAVRSGIAREQEEVGRLAEAFVSAKQCVRDLEFYRSLPEREHYLAYCTELRDRLAGRVAYLVLQLPSAPRGLVVKIQGQEVRSEIYGEPFLVTPGVVTVEATAPGHFPFRDEVAVPEGARQPVPVALNPQPAPAEPQSAPAPCPTGQIREGAGCVDPLGVAARAEDPGRSKRHWGIALAATGLAAVVAGTISWYAADARFKALRDSCARNECRQAEASSGKSTIRLLDRLSVGGAVLGGALLATGTGFYFSGRW
jgi:hypothetical protein